MTDEYSNEEINEFLADMQAQFDLMVSELRDRIEELAADIEATKPKIYGWRSLPIQPMDTNQFVITYDDGHFLDT